MAKPLSPIELSELRALDRDGNLTGSDREEDRARGKLKRRGYIEFDRPAWLWRMTDAGRAALQEAGQ